MDHNATGALAAFAGLFMAAGVVVLGLVALNVWMYYRLFEKTGMNGALGLLILIPGGSLVCAIVLAFSEWPIERELRAYRAGTLAGGMPPGNPPGNPPIGGLPMNPR